MVDAENLKITDDLRVVIGASTTQLSPSQGLHVAEMLARKSFRRALTEEADISLAGSPFPLGGML